MVSFDLKANRNLGLFGVASSFGRWLFVLFNESDTFDDRQQAVDKAGTRGEAYSRLLLLPPSPASASCFA